MKIVLQNVCITFKILDKKDSCQFQEISSQCVSQIFAKICPFCPHYSVGSRWNQRVSRFWLGGCYRFSKGVKENVGSSQGRWLLQAFCPLGQSQSVSRKGAGGEQLNSSILSKGNIDIKGGCSTMKKLALRSFEEGIDTDIDDDILLLSLCPGS